MHMALERPSRIESLICVDMSPIVLNLTTTFAHFVRAMQEIQSAKVTTSHEADAMLAKTIPELPVRQFILTNLKHVPEQEHLSFRVNLDSLDASLSGQHGIAGFPLSDAGKTYDGPSLFVKGNRSGYVPDSSIPHIKGLFPTAKVEGIDAGHWVHSEKPTEFIKVVEAFIKQHQSPQN